MLAALSRFIQSAYTAVMFSSTRRTPTGTQNVFNLSHPNPVSFDFSTLSMTGLKITIPPYSGWVTQSHWHETAPACETIEPLEGCFMISHSSVTSRSSGNVIGGGKGFVMPIVPGIIVKWQRDPLKKSGAGAEREAVVFSLKGSVEMFDFYRQVCSVNQDAEVYFRLPSTPLWLRGLYASWAWVPYFGTRVRAWLVNRLLWVQLRVIYHKNDYLTYEGAIPYTWPWWDLPGAQKPPEKWMDRELKSRVTISKLVQKWCYWIGTTLLGMRERYEEYNTAGSQDLGVDIKGDLIKG